MSLTQASAAIVAPLSRRLAAESANPVFQAANLNDLANDSHKPSAYA